MVEVKWFHGDEDAMNDYMNEVALHTFSYFDSGKDRAGRRLAFFDMLC